MQYKFILVGCARSFALSHCQNITLVGKARTWVMQPLFRPNSSCRTCCIITTPPTLPNISQSVMKVDHLLCHSSKHSQKIFVWLIICSKSLWEYVLQNVELFPLRQKIEFVLCLLQKKAKINFYCAVQSHLLFGELFSVMKNAHYWRRLLWPAFTSLSLRINMSKFFWRKLAKLYVLLDDLDFCTERKNPSQILYTDYHQSKIQSAVT